MVQGLKLCTASATGVCHTYCRNVCRLLPLFWPQKVHITGCHKFILTMFAFLAIFQFITLLVGWQKVYPAC